MERKARVRVQRESSVGGAARRVWMAALWLGALLIAAPVANAADITGQVNVAVSLNTAGVPNEVGPAPCNSGAGCPAYWSYARPIVRVVWSVPATAVPGDSFTIAIDPNLNPQTFVPTDLTAADGVTVVARTTREASRIRFTLSDYVASQQGVGGATDIGLRFASTAVPVSGARAVNVVNRTVVVKRAPAPTGDANYMYGYWTPNEAAATARDAAGALVQRTAQMRWVVQLKTRVGNPERNWRTVTLTQTPQTGLNVRCDDLRVRIVDSQDRPAPASVTAQTLSCTPDTLRLRVTKPIGDAGVYRVGVNMFLSTNSSGQPTHVVGSETRIGIRPGGYGNEVMVDYDGVQHLLRSTLGRGQASGTVGGFGPRSSIIGVINNRQEVVGVSRTPGGTAVAGSAKVLVRMRPLVARPRPGASLPWRITVTNRTATTYRNVRVCLRPGRTAFTAGSVRYVVTAPKVKPLRATARVVRVRKTGERCFTVRAIRPKGTMTLVVRTTTARRVRGTLTNRAAVTVPKVGTVRVAAIARVR